MRCLACDRALTDFEATRKSAYTNQFIDLCNTCFSSISDEMQTIERTDLAHEDGEGFEELGTDLNLDKEENLW